MNGLWAIVYGRVIYFKYRCDRRRRSQILTTLTGGTSPYLQAKFARFKGQFAILIIE
jgi:hypothetical protein